MSIDFTQDELNTIKYFIRNWYPDTDKDQQTKKSILRKI